MVVAYLDGRGVEHDADGGAERAGREVVVELSADGAGVACEPNASASSSSAYSSMPMPNSLRFPLLPPLQCVVNSPDIVRPREFVHDGRKREAYRAHA